MPKTYNCSNCNSAVRKNHNTFKVNVPLVDGRGIPKYERVRDKQTGDLVWKMRTVEKQARGLGHWHCVRQCLGADMKTKVKVTKS